MQLLPPSNDGHFYIPEMYQKGIRHFLVSANSAVDYPLYPDAHYYQVEDTLQAMQELARLRRSAFSAPVLGITGSNGKTIVKEWLAYALAAHYHLLKSPQSYNSQLGVAVSVFPLNDEHDLGLFEAGISQKGEMARLAEIIQPSHGIFSNLGSAHHAGFADRDEKFREKWQLFRSAQVVYLRSTYLPQAEEVVRHWIHQPELKCWSLVEEAGQWFYHLPGGLTLSLPAHHSQTKADLDNRGHVAAVLADWGWSSQAILEVWERLPPVEMRLELKEGWGNMLIVDDTYNNDLQGLEAALEQAQHWAKDRPMEVVLTEMEGVEPSEINRVLKTAGSPKGYYIASEPPEQDFPLQYLERLDPLLKDPEQVGEGSSLILVKGARAYRMERLVERLVRQTHATRLEIDLNALRHNIRLIKQQLPPQCKVMAMVKAFGYGSGDFQVAALFQQSQVDYLAVAYTDEAIELRKQGIHLPIAISNAAQMQVALWEQYQLEPIIHSLEALEQVKERSQLRIHLNLDTGMHRLGILEEEPLSETLTNAKVQVVGLMTHLAAADDPQEDAYTKGQLEEFERRALALEEVLGYSTTWHALNTAGILRFSEYAQGMVRPGIGLYGINPSADQELQFEPVFHFYAQVAQVKELPAGATVGYGRVYQTQKPLRMAVLSLGYADGFFRAFSQGRGWVRIQGRVCPVIGNVCMDMVMVDIGDLELRAGETAEVYGPENRIEELAAAIDTIPYELIAGISGRVQRVYRGEYT